MSSEYSVLEACIIAKGFLSALYTLIHNDFEAFSNTIKSSMEGFMTSKTFCDPQTGKSISGISVFGSISTVLFE